MVRRRVAWVLTFVMGMVCTPLASLGQDAKVGKIARIGRLSALSADADAPILEAFRNGMRDLGWVEGRSFAIEPRFADGRIDRLPELAAQLVREPVDLILVGSTPGALIAKKATNTIPIVMVTTGDPIRSGIVPSLARPGGNVTGVTTLGDDLNAKRLELIKEAFQGITKVAVLVNPGTPYTDAFLIGKDSAARALGLDLRILEARNAEQLDAAFALASAEQVGALMILSDVMFITQQRRIVELAAKSRLPVVYPEREFVDTGGLMFYGASLVDMYRHAATYADKILKGAKPADLPIEQPTNLNLVINLKTAKALGITFRPSLLSRADHVLQ